MRYSSERINRIAADNRYQELINASEAKHILQFENLVRMITESHRHSLNKNITDAVLITGPSSSGKTTTSKLVAAMLEEQGFHVILVSFDDYYYDTDYIRELQGKPADAPMEELDLECPEAFDIAYFKEQMGAFLSGETVTLPVFDFLSKKRVPGRTVTPSDRDVIILEGIHALNPIVTEGVPFSKTFKVYICPFDTYSAPGVRAVMKPQDVRFMRRSVRDQVDRNSDLMKTLSMWPSVRAGEEKYIKPMKAYADFFFNSSLEYEICLLKYRFMKMVKVLDASQLAGLKECFPLEVLEAFCEIEQADVPEGSIFREFYK